MSDRSIQVAEGHPENVPVAAAEPLEARIDPAGGGLRARAARGTIINGAFQIGLAALELVKRFTVVAFLTAAEFGFWGLIVVALASLLWLKQIGIADKYIQQSDLDQETAFQKAFTLELLLSLLFWLLILLVLPIYALIYGRPEIILPGAVLSLSVLASAWSAPNWIWYRRMEFLKQRQLAAVNPVVTFVVTVPLAISGLGYWSLVVGAVVGSVAGAAASVRASPYRPGFRFDRFTLREYASFSWPLFILSASNLVIIQAAVIVGEATVGLAGVGVIGLAGVIARFGDQVNGIVTQTIYPAVCIVRERTDLLFEAFVKSNRLALMWGVTFGLGLTLFAPDLVEFVLGQKWNAAIPALQVFGGLVAVKQLGFNWTAFMRARNETRPLATNGVLAMVTFLAIGVPLMVTSGLTGYIVGFSAAAVVQLLLRTYHLRRLFHGFGMVRHAMRALLPSLPAVAAVLGMRALEVGDARSAVLAASELLLYLALTAGATAFLERNLLREVAGYLRKRPHAPAGQPAGPVAQ